MRPHRMRHRRSSARGPTCALLTLVVLAFCATPRPALALTAEEVLARFNHEPSVQQVQDAAIRYYLVHPDHIRSLLRGARLKALVPSISGEFSNGLDHTRRRMEDALYRPTLPWKRTSASTATRSAGACRSAGSSTDWSSIPRFSTSSH
jgi:hypothetical protein